MEVDVVGRVVETVFLRPSVRVGSETGDFITLILTSIRALIEQIVLTDGH